MNHLQALKNRINGPIYSIVTPFNPKNDDIDYQSLEKYLDTVYLAGGRIFYIMGYNSRLGQLSWEETKTLNTFVTKMVKGFRDDTVAIAAAPLHCSTATCIDFCRHADAIGADMISLIFLERLYSNEQIIKHYTMCAAATDMGILIHEMDLGSGFGNFSVKWPIEVLDILADVPTIIAIKEDAKDFAYTNEVLARIKDRMAIIHSGGGKRAWLKFADAGCHAWLNGIGIFEPRLASLFWTAFTVGDKALCSRITDEIETPFFEKIVHVYGWHIAIKAALEVCGHMSRHDRMPLMPVHDADAQNIKQIMDSLPIAEIVQGLR